MSHLHERFAAALKAAREASGWSQALLAERVGLSIEAYGRLERGRVLPRTATLVRLARVLRVPLDCLLGITPVPPPAAADDLRIHAVLGRIREATPEELQLLITILSEVQRWRREALELRRA